ncbi:MAG: 30S ribosomal protein S20 [Rhodopirellula sp.]|nr:30S ribosomal protein S20 [Rhodopirellula sp.]
MPNIKSAKKRLRQSIVRRARNRSTKSELRTLCRKVREAVAAGNVGEAETLFRTTTKKLDRASAHNVIHANAAARVKSRLSAAIKAVKQGKVEAS